MNEIEDSHFIIEPDSIIKDDNVDSKLKTYLELLQLENERTNLVSRETMPSDLKRLIVESLVPIKKIPKVRFDSYLDIGSGGGLPSIPIIISTNPEKAILSERIQKKASALRRMLMALDLNAEVIEESFEESGFESGFKLITVRLVRLSTKLISKIEESLSPGGLFIYYGHFEKGSVSTNLVYRHYSYNTGENSPVKSFTVFHRPN